MKHQILLLAGKDEQAVVETQEEMNKTAALLGLDVEEFTECLLKPKMKVPRQLHNVRCRNECRKNLQL